MAGSGPRQFALPCGARPLPRQCASCRGIPLFSFGEVQQPLPPFGMLGIDATAFVTMPTVGVSPPGGTTTQLLLLPALPALHGSTFFSQAMLLDPNAPQQPLRLTGALFDRVR